MNIDFNDVKEYLIPTIVAGITWLSKDRILDALSIKEKKISVEDARMNTLQSNLDYYQDLVEDLSVKYKIRLDELEAELEKFKELNKRMSKIIDEQRSFIIKQSASLKKYATKFGDIDNKTKK